MEQRIATSLFELRPRPGDVCRWKETGTTYFVEEIQYTKSRYTGERHLWVYFEFDPEDDNSIRARHFIKLIQYGDVQLFRDGVELVCGRQALATGEGK